MLYLVSTPIGNLKDITFRAIEILNSVDLIACEDTRHSLFLLNHYNIKKPLLSYHKFNLRESGLKIIENLKQGKTVALITDAGMPGISDPGKELVQLCLESKEPYTIIPGANAALSALILSGFDSALFAFCGFIPKTSKEIKSFFDKIKKMQSTLIFYCAPHSINKDLETINKFLGNRKCAAVKEITKIYESVQFINACEKIEEPKGEYVLIVEGLERADDNPLNQLTIEEHIDYYLKQNISKMEAIKLVAKDRALSKSVIYNNTIINVKKQAEE